MIIVIASDSVKNINAHTFIRNGWGKALSASGHDVYIWDIYSKNCIDIFDELNPDLFWGLTYHLDRSTLKAISERPNLKVILTGSDWSKYSDKIDINKFPIVRANKKEIRLVEELNNFHKIEFICCHYHDKHINKTHHYWKDRLGINIHGLPLGCDISDYCNSIVMPEFISDITHISGYWPFKAQIIDKWFLPLCSHELDLNIKVFGRGWGIPQFYGSIPNNLVKNAFKSAKVNINISEPHAHSVGSHEINEKIFKQLAGKNTVVSDYTESIAQDFFPNGEVLFAKTPQEFKSLCLAVINNDLTIDVEKGYESVMNNHTYFHRCAELFNYLKLPTEANNILLTYQKIRKENNL